MKKFDNSVKITLIIVLGILVLSVIVLAFFNYNFYSKTITSTGTASVEVLPDFVGVYFNVQTEGDTGKEASDGNSEIVNQMTENLLALGFSKDGIQTQGFSVSPNYKWVNNEYKEDGYVASHSIKVEIPVEDREKIGEVLDAGINAGAGISYINYELNKQNQEKYKAEAIKLATENARSKAEAIAIGAGQRLGGLISVSSSDFGYTPWLAVAETEVSRDSGQITSQITPSEQEISASVTAVFRI